MRLLHVLFVISHLSLVTTQIYDPSDTLGYDASNIDDLQAGCGDILKNCPGGFPASTDCTENWCDQNCADPDNCCGLDDRLSCFQSSSNSSNFTQCTFIADRVSSCSSATTGFATLPLTDQVNCFCYDKNSSYDGYSWDNAAKTCYGAIESQTLLATSDLDDYLSSYVGACTVFIDTSELGSTGTRSGVPSATATPAASSSMSGPTTRAGTSSSPSGVTAGTPPPTTTASRKSSGAVKNGLEGCELVPGALLFIICCMFASL